MGMIGFVGAGSLSVLGSGRPSTGGALGKHGRKAGLSRSSRCNVKMVISQEAASSVNPSGTESKLISKTPEWKALKEHAEQEIPKTAIKELLQDDDRNESMIVEYDDIVLDFSRQRANKKTMQMLFDLAERADLKGKIQGMVSGEKMNVTENRAVLHTALRAARDEKIMVDGVNVVDEVYEVLDRIKYFSDRVRSGELRGATGKKIINFVACGIGGSYLGPDFAHEALKTDQTAAAGAGDRHLRFLANVDPVDVKRATMELDPEETMVIIISKTFTTRETMVNAITMKDWLTSAMGEDPEVIAKHMVACSSNVEKAKEFGIDPNNVFGFWDWVGGRYSVCSAVGAVPLSLQYGFDSFRKFLEGARSIDKHFATAPLDKNLPVLMGLLGVWNISFLGFRTRAMHPYTEALVKLPAHIQQVDMESNGKHVTVHGEEVDFDVGEIDWGEPGTNGQHSFFQLLHMGQVVPCDFIGFCESQYPICESGLPVSNHDELMANFFAQPDALANGKTAEECRADGVPEWLIPHKTFSGNRPSVSVLMRVLNAYATGQLLALYEHRTATEGFIWDLNSFDQWGVELGKTLATTVRQQIARSRFYNEEPTGFNSSTKALLNLYLKSAVGCVMDEPEE